MTDFIRRFRPASFLALAGIAFTWPHSPAVSQDEPPAPETPPAQPSPAVAINKRQLPAKRLSAPPVIDGNISDAVWEEAAKADLFTDALFGTAVSDQTVAWIGFDDVNLYVAFYAYDAEPEKIVGRETKRGTPFRGEDYITFSIDPFNTFNFRDRSYFTVNPLGTQFSQLAGGRANKLEWEGAWKAATKMAADGWTAEMAIPWSILNYPAGGSPTTSGINFDRFQERTKIHSWWSNIGPNEFLELNGQWVGVVFPPFQRQLSLLPYVSPGWREDKPSIHAGLDIRSRLTPTLTGVATINPDFENVESAVEGIDFSYGERFVPDRRPFFNEGSDIYSNGTATGLFFHSSRIEQFDTGLNLYGKLTNRDTIGALATVDFNNEFNAVLRGIHTFGPTSRADMLLINHQKDGKSNRVLLVGEDFRKGFWSLNADWVGSWANDRFKGDTGSVTMEYSSPHFESRLTPRYIDPDFTDELGFIQFKGYRGISTSNTYSNEWREGFLRRMWIDHDYEHDNNYDGDVFRRWHDFDIEVETRSDYSLNVGWEGGRFEEFNDSIYNVTLQANTSDPFHTFGIGYSWGRQAGHPLSFITPTVAWRFGKKLTLGLASSILQHEEDRFQHVFTFNYDFSPQRGIGGRVISQTGGTGGYLAFRNAGYGGVEQWLILGDPNSRKFRSRLVAKIVWPM